MGVVKVPADKYWGAQTQRSIQNFDIGSETMPEPLITALAIVKKSIAKVGLLLIRLMLRGMASMKI